MASVTTSVRSMILLAAAVLAQPAAPVVAFDLFDPFGAGKARPPAPSDTTLPYTLSITGADDALTAAVAEASVLQRLAHEPPLDGLDLARRAEADLSRLTDALWGQGYYAARVAISVAGERLVLGQSHHLTAAEAAERARAASLVPVTIMIEAGPRYTFMPVRVSIRRAATFDETTDVPPGLYADVAGAPAVSSTLMAAAGRITHHYRQNGHPYATIEDPEPVIDHRARTVAVTLLVKPGPRARIGAPVISGAEGVETRVIRSFIYTDHDVMFSPERMSDIRRSVARIEAVGSVRVQPADTLAADGSVPVNVQITERPRNVLGGSARYATSDGPGLSLYWADRNMFGGAERLRLAGDLFYLPQSFTQTGRNGAGINNLGGRLEASFLKPALGGTRLDLLADASVARTSTEAYISRLANITTGFRYRLAEKTWLQAGLLGEIGKTQDSLGRLNYRMIGLPLSGNWDTTDSELDPTGGFRVSGSVMPAYGAGDIGRWLVVSRLQASAYHAIDEQARIVLAGRIALGSAAGGAVHEIPANWRFFAGGGGSIRGYDYRSIGPRDPGGRLIGGRSLFEASVEARFRVTETIGIVPFVDAGAAFASSMPDFDETIRFGAGIGLRYHTAIGPIRIDVATPLNRQRKEKPVAFYISLGQAF